MGKEDVQQHIEEMLENPTEITAEDLEPPVCQRCDKWLVGDMDIFTWDVPSEDEELIYRHRYCSDECREEDKEAVMLVDDPHPYGEAEVIDPDEYDDEIKQKV